MDVHLLTFCLFLVVGDCQEVTELRLLESSFMSITSPGYPEPYNGTSGRRWTVTAPLNRRVFISFEDFDTKHQFDQLLITDVVWSSHGRTHSGQQHFPPFLSLSDSAHIEFHPYGWTPGNRRGFHLNASCYADESATTRLNEGRLELKQDGWWMPICSEDWDEGKSDIACRELGYPGAFESVSNESSRVNSTRIRSCERSPHRLQDCATEVAECQTGIINLKCQYPGYIGCYNINDMNVNRQPTISVRSARECIIWCHKRRYDTAIIQGPHCYCSNESTSRLQNANCRAPCVWNTDEPCADNIRSESVPVFSTLVGFCPQPKDPMDGSWRGEGPYYYGSTVEVNCHPQFKLKEASNLLCAATEGRNKFSPEWMGSASCIHYADQQESTSPPVDPTDSGMTSCAPSPYLMACLLAVLYMSSTQHALHRKPLHN